MTTHIKVLGILHLVLGFLLVLGGLFGMVFFGGLATLVGIRERAPDALVGVSVLAGIGGIVLVAAVLLAVPGLVAGFGLLQFRPWARILTIILSALELLNVPFGTALGIYGLWVLTQPESERLLGAGVRV